MYKMTECKSLLSFRGWMLILCSVAALMMVFLLVAFPAKAAWVEPLLGSPAVLSNNSHTECVGTLSGGGDPVIIWPDTRRLHLSMQSGTPLKVQWDSAVGTVHGSASGATVTPPYPLLAPPLYPVHPFNPRRGRRPIVLERITRGFMVTAIVDCSDGSTLLVANVHYVYRLGTNDPVP